MPSLFKNTVFSYKSKFYLLNNKSWLLLTGGWWVCEKLQDINGPVCIEIGPQSYISALDNGLFTVGAPRDEGKQPTHRHKLYCFVFLLHIFSLRWR